MNHSQQFAQISGLQDLSEEILQKLASSLSSNEEFFSEEEAYIRGKISKASSKKASINTQIDNLEIVEHPGIKPNREKVNDIIKSIFGGWIGLVILMFIIHCIMWCVRLVSDSSWDTWKWTTNLFLYGLIICILAYFGLKIWYHISLAGWEAGKESYTEYKDNEKRLHKAIEDENQRIKNYQSELQKINDNRARVLVQAYRQKGLPLKSLATWDYSDAKRTYFSLLKSMQEAYLTKNQDEIITFINTKFGIFYNRSLDSETPSAEVLKAFKTSVPFSVDGKINREVTIPSETSSNSLNHLSTQLAYYKANEMDKYIDEFDEVLNMDTSGFFTKQDSSLLETQTNKMQSVYNRCTKVISGFQNLVHKLNHTLGVCRLVAFRNIYLGAELLNIAHKGAGGGKSTTSSDKIDNIEIGDFEDIDISKFSLSDSLNNMVSNGLDSMSNFITEALTQKDTRKYVANNPKTAALAAVGAAAFGAINAGLDAWKNRNAKINDLINKQEQIFKVFEQSIEAYEVNYPLALRSLELIEAIVKINTGFATIYKPLYDKIFVQRNLTSVSMQELHGLARALNEYNNITKTKL